MWLIGDGPLLSQIRELAQDLQLSEKIKFLGKKNYVGPYMKAAKAVLLPSIIEGLPAVILEAFYHKVFVIAFDVGGIAEVLNNETGWLVPAGDEFAFVSAVTEALSSTDDKRIKQKAFEQVMSSYTNEVIAKQFEMIYRKLAMENELTDNEQTKDSPHH